MSGSRASLSNTRNTNLVIMNIYQHGKTRYVSQTMGAETLPVVLTIKASTVPDLKKNGLDYQW